MIDKQTPKCTLLIKHCFESKRQFFLVKKNFSRIDFCNDLFSFYWHRLSHWKCTDSQLNCFVFRLYWTHFYRLLSVSVGVLESDSIVVIVLTCHVINVNCFFLVRIYIRNFLCLHLTFLMTRKFTVCLTFHLEKSTWHLSRFF